MSTGSRKAAQPQAKKSPASEDKSKTQKSVEPPAAAEKSEAASTSGGAVTVEAASSGVTVAAKGDVTITATPTKASVAYQGKVAEATVTVAADRSGATVQAAQGGVTVTATPTNAAVTYEAETGDATVSIKADRSGGTAEVSAAGATIAATPRNASVSYKGEAGGVSVTAEADRAGGTVAITNEEGKGVGFTPTGLDPHTGNEVADTVIKIATDPIGSLKDLFSDDDDDSNTGAVDWPVQTAIGVMTSDGQLFPNMAAAEIHQQALDAVADHADQAFAQLDALGGAALNEMTEAGDKMLETLNEMSDEGARIRIVDSARVYSPTPLSVEAVGKEQSSAANAILAQGAISGIRTGVEEDARNAAAAVELGLNKLSTERIGEGVTPVIPGIGTAGIPGHSYDVSLTGITDRSVPTREDLASRAGMPDLGAASSLGKSSPPAPSRGFADPRIASGPATGRDFARQELDKEAERQQRGESDGMDEGELQDLAEKSTDPAMDPVERAEVYQEIGAEPTPDDQAKADDVADKSETHGESPPGDFATPEEGDTAVATPNPDGADPVNARTAEFHRWISAIVRTDPRSDPMTKSPSDPGRDGSGTGVPTTSPQERRVFGEELASGRLNPYINPQPEGDGPVAGSEAPEFVNTLVDPPDMAGGGLLGGAGLPDADRRPGADGPGDDDGTPDH